MGDNQLEVRLNSLHQKTSSKWRRYNCDVLPMHVAEMDFDVADPIRDEITSRVSRSDLGYLGPIPELGESFSAFAVQRWQWQLDPKLVTPAIDVGVAAVEIFRVLASPGDSVLINSPVYTNFFTWIEEAKLKLVDVPLIRNSNGWQLDLAGIETAFKSGVKLYLLCNPQNPVGKVHSSSELAAIAQLANSYGVHVISDEIHAPLTYAEQTFTPYLTLPAAQETGFTITSASKAWNIAGLKAAVIVAGSTSASRSISAMPPAVHWRTSIVGAFAMVAAFRQGVSWLDQTLLALDQNRNQLKSLLNNELPDIEYLLPESSYLAWLDLREFGKQANWHDLILSKGKLAIVPGQDFGKPYSDFVRFNFATYPAVLTEGVARLKQALT